MSQRRLNVGLIGLGRLGIKYARDIATAIPEMRLAAVADINSDLAASVAAQYGVPTWTPDPFAMIRNPGVDTVVIASPTAAHRDHTIAALNEGKPTFCEKPPSIVLRDAETMRDAAIKSGTFLQMGFMRRFDRGYAAAKQQLDNGVIGDPVLIKCCSRDPSPPSLAYANPASSGGTIVDMGIHDFDLCRFFVGEVDRVHSIGGAFACPEFATINDVDTAVVSLTFNKGAIGVVDLSRHSGYGYDIRTEILGTKGALQIGYLQETPIVVLKPNAVTHDTIPHFPERFAGAYPRQLQDFAINVLQGRPASVTIDDGIAALRIGLAAARSHATGTSVVVNSVEAVPAGA